MQTARLYDDVHARLKAQSSLKRVDLTELLNALVARGVEELEKGQTNLAELPEPKREDLERGKIGK